ncbi:MAG TPA: hypothetical protein VLU73_07785 [Methylococcaceae bacterium]|jgi:hypothetical protein|nr:hypothetical protein [Methylococcaceae bacterium]
MTDKLLRDIEYTAPETMEDLLLVMAKNVEASLIKGGAKPGIDYEIIDLYQLAQPFALEIFRKNINTISYTTRW